MTAKKRTITLTNRRPVRIIEDEWPVIAQVDDDSYGGADYVRHQQALSQGEVDRWHLRVRQNPDERVLVYAVIDAASAAWNQPAGGHDYRGGEMLDGIDNVVAAIKRVVRRASKYGMPTRLADELIAELPPEEV